MPNPHEDRARSIKAAKLARVVEAILAEDASLTLADVRDAPDGFWARVAGVAGCAAPGSQATKDAVVEIVRVRAGRNE